jgi:hypothetical protein
MTDFESPSQFSIDMTSLAREIRHIDLSFDPTITKKKGG